MNILSDFIGALKEAQHGIKESLVLGQANTFDAYQKMVGQHLGLQQALDILDDLLNEKDSDNDR